MSFTKRLFSGIIVMMLAVVACQPIVAPQPGAAPAAASSLDEETVAAIEAVIEQGMQDYHTPGLALGIVKNGELVYAKGFGVAELGSDRPVTPQSVFTLSAIARTAVSTAIMQLVEQGQIDLDAPVTDYLPYFSLADERYTQITVRHLLSDTSGVPTWEDEDWFGPFEEPEFDDGALERQVRSLSNQTLMFEPGERWELSSTGYNVLGDVIAKVSGQTFEAYIEEHIFVPLGMANSTFLISEVDPDQLVSPHLPGESGEPIVSAFYPYTRQHAPGTSFLSNVEDMARYALVHLQRGELDGVRILDSSAYDRIWESYGETWFLPWQGESGLGWAFGDYEGRRVIGYGGLDPGFNTIFILLPEESLAISLFVNYSDVEEVFVPAHFLTEPILDVLLGIEQ